MMNNLPLLRYPYALFAAIFGILLLQNFSAKGQNAPAGASGRTIVAHVVALDQPYFYNRFGAQQPTGTVFALLGDVVKIDPGKGLVAGNVKLRNSKRPRPIVIRINKGDILEVHFTNMLTPYVANSPFQFNFVDRDTLVKKVLDSMLISLNPSGQPLTNRTRTAAFHPAGLELVGDINSDASWVGANDNSQANPGGIPPGGSKTYRFYGAEEGVFLITPGADNIGENNASNGQNSTGLFGGVVVEPEDALYFRSQVTNEDMAMATSKWVDAQGYASTPDKGLPIINWDAVYPDTFWDVGRRGLPILNMLQQKGNNRFELVNTDLTALITGPNGGYFSYDKNDPDYFNVPASPGRNQPFREFVTIYHESPFTVQAFPIGYTSDENLQSTVSAGADAFSINYGSGGIGAEIYANRIGVGPAADCLECAYEEFFLSAWAVGDPAMVVDVPANTAWETNKGVPNQPIERMPVDKIGKAGVDNLVLNSLVGQLENAMGVYKIANGKDPSFDPPQPYTYKATKALYPDDPSNVYHSYLGDHVKFRVLHGGGIQTHVHHQHAHQWLHSPNSDNGHYLDSQVLNPGESYTLEMVYNGSGNRNQTVGDAIFHCHFYPHFAGGMWAMWRVHDVFEAGTKYNSVQKLEMAPGARALPDAEIISGTPIPGLVPLPALPMAPVPGSVSLDKNGQVVVTDPSTNPGYPFFIPGVAGRRPPHPPLDFAVDTSNTALDGGLPRHVIVGGKVKWENHSVTDWTKIMGEAVAIQLPEEGTVVEKTAMAAHAKRAHPTVTTEGQPANYIYNGLPPVAGAPFADPAISDDGNAIGQKRIYKAANIQMDAVFNKEGWHYPQQRLITLWGDVASTLNGIRPPEPFFFRANTFEFVEYWHTNLVPEYYELDDYQVRTPTDILGQHIHLVKFDVTSSDGAANGFNYEDGTFSPGTVQERIKAINKAGGIYQYSATNNGAIDNLSLYPKTRVTLSLKPPDPIWGRPPAPGEWDGAQTTIQRWYADPLYNNNHEDQTLRTVFTHDHFGPSTHQQVGLYAGLLVEPASSTWIDPITGETMGQMLPNRQPKKRKVSVYGTDDMEVSDGGPTSYQANIILPNQADSYREFALEFQDLALAYTAQSISSINPYPAIPDTGNVFKNKAFLSQVAKYTGWQDANNAINGPCCGIGLISPGPQGAYSVNYRNEPVPLRVDSINGATVPGPAGDIAYGFQSRTDRANPNFRKQPVGGGLINPGSSFKFPKNPISANMGPGDPYTPLFRAYQGDKIQVRTLVGAHLKPHYFNIHGVNWLFEPSNPESGYRSTQSMGISEHFEMLFQLPTTGKPTNDYLYMPSASLPGMQYGTWGIMRAYDNINKQQNLVPLPYNIPNTSTRMQGKSCGCPDGAPLKTETVVAVESQKALKGPLVLNADQNISKNNGLFLVRKSDLNTDGTLKTGVPVEPLVLRFNAGDCIKLTLENQIGLSPEPTDGNFGITNNLTLYLNPSSTVGLSPTLLSFDVTDSDGANVGLNPEQTVSSGSSSKTYTWYAGKWERQPDGSSKPEPVEFGAVVLQPADNLEQPSFGMEAALIIEPEGAQWVEDVNSRASATVYNKAGSLLFREFVLIYNDLMNAANYGSENIANRVKATGRHPHLYQYDLTSAFSNQLAGEPATPVFAAKKGTPVRLHLPTAQGSGNGAVFELHGHVWQEEPYGPGSKTLGYNPMSEWKGSQGQIGAFNSFEILLDKAGGEFEVPGDYLYSSLATQSTEGGFWGVMRVTDAADVPTVNTISRSGSTWTITGNNTVNFSLGNGASSKANVFASSVELFDANNNRVGNPVPVDPFTGKWAFASLSLNMGAQYTIKSTDGKGTVFGIRSFKANAYGGGTVDAKPLALNKKARQIPGRQKAAKKPAEPKSNPHMERLIRMGNLPHENNAASQNKNR